MKTPLLPLLAACSCLVLPQLLSARTWTEAGTGRTLDGDLVKTDGANAVIRRANGTTVNIPLAKLSEEDQSFVKTQSGPKIPASVPAEGVTLTGVHLCCGGCERGVEKAVAGVEGLELAIDADAETVTLKSSSPETVLKALESLAAGGYYGASSTEGFQIAPVEASSAKADTVEVAGVHLCCGTCVKAVGQALAEVEGFASHNAAKNSPTFTVTGKDLTASAVLAALRKHGLSGTVK